MKIIEELNDIEEHDEYVFRLESKECAVRAIAELGRHGIVVGVGKTPSPHVSIFTHGWTGKYEAVIGYARMLLKGIPYYENNILRFKR